MSAVYWGALLLGLSSSFHCFGMCGPLVMAIPMKSKSKVKRAFGITQYHVGKTFTYALLGLIVGLVGISIQAFKWMQVLSVISGVVIIFFAWESFIRLPFGQKIQQSFTRVAGKSLRALFKSNLPFKPLFFGMINGLLPCGLIYVALINSLLAGSPTGSATAMIFFGLGTVPVLTLAKWISMRIKWKSTWITPILITLVGVMIIFRGLNLGIPLLSPKINTHLITDSHGNTVEESKLECCTVDEPCED